MSELSKRERAELLTLKRRIEHAERQHVASLTRAFRRLPPELDDAAERMLELKPGMIARWRDGDDVLDVIGRVFAAMRVDAHERRNGGES
jgi:hypothetical protein